VEHKGEFVYDIFVLIFAIEILLFVVSVYLRYRHIVTRRDVLRNTHYSISYAQIIKMIDEKPIEWGNAVWKGGEIFAVIFPEAFLRGKDQFSLFSKTSVFRGNQRFTLNFQLWVYMQLSKSKESVYGFIPQELCRMFQEQTIKQCSVLSIEDWYRKKLMETLEENPSYKGEIKTGLQGPDYDIVRNAVRNVCFINPSNAHGAHASLMNIVQEAINTK